MNFPSNNVIYQLREQQLGYAEQLVGLFRNSINRVDTRIDYNPHNENSIINIINILYQMNQQIHQTAFNSIPNNTIPQYNIHVSTLPDLLSTLFGELNDEFEDILQRTIDEHEPIETQLNPNIISQLPIDKYDSENEKHNIEQCTICQTTFQNGDPIKMLPCNHYFVPEAIDAWFQYNNTCPTCRMNIQEQFGN